MTRRGTHCALALAVLFGACTLFVRPAAADDAETKERLMLAEHAIVDGRLQDVPAVLRGGESPSEEVVREIARRWWRRMWSPQPVEAKDGDLQARRLAWALRGETEPPYPMPAGGGAEDPTPLLTALVRDRIHRETIGWYGLVTLPEHGGTSIHPQTGPDSPLQAYLTATDGGRTPEEQAVLEFALAMQWRSYVGDEDPAEMDILDKKATKAANQARVIYLGLLGSLLVSAFLATLIVSRDRDGARHTSDR